MDFLIRFLYTGSANFDKTFPDLKTLVAISKAWKLADFFCLEALECLLDRAISDKTKSIAICLCSPNKPEKHDDSLVEGEIIQSIRALYQDDVAAVRHKMLEHVLMLVFTVLHQLKPRKTFLDLFKEIPEFAVDWATGFVSSMNTILPAFKGSYNCTYCGWASSESNVIVNSLTWNIYRDVEVMCPDCFEVPTLGQWNRF